ncbi:TPA: hypothetical protein ACH3X3_001377 [Trebouxia sp. C0006]
MPLNIVQRLLLPACKTVRPSAARAFTARLSAFHNSGQISSLLSRAVGTKHWSGHTRSAGTSATVCMATAMSESNPITVGDLEVQRIPCLSDNYVWLLQEKTSGKVAVVDPSEFKPVASAIQERGLKLDYILNTHHHWDHTGGNEELKSKFQCTIVGPKADKGRIPGIDIALADGESWQFGDLEMQVFDTPGHTRGHITLWFPQVQALFPGDTLFALGCGRMFEGNAQQMWTSLSKLKPLPPATKVFCAHEYTQSNAKFALSIDPDNHALQKRAALVNDLRKQGIPTIPSTLQEELDTNPFLRPDDPAIRKNLRVPEGASTVDAFAAVRKAKDNF